MYERHAEQGRMLPAGLHYIDSWLEQGGDRCFQLMESGSFELFATWTVRWDDLVDFEILPLEPSPTNE